ncbi:MAG TPA: helix-turn-helix domain-containing protein [Longimicrobiaceae bacterium]|nr:helix-turn-helix domain-containing protein [Longimicrobiaceae bacterium]
MEIPGQLYRLTELSDWKALREALGRAPLTAVAVVDPLGPDGGIAEELRELLRAFPFATVLAALPVTPRDGELLRTLLDCGVADFIVMGHETTPVGVSRRLRLVRSRPVKRLLKRALPQGVPSRTQGMLTRAAEVVAVGGGAPELAAALRVSPRTVPRWCERADLPPPRRLFAWLRMLMAAELLDQPQRSLASVARACGYANESSLKNTFRDFLGVGPSELRKAGAFQTVATAFARDLASVREHAHTAGRSRNVWLN